MNKTLKTILVRLGDGVLLGIGAIVTVGVFSTMKDASENLEESQGLLEVQMEFNSELQRRIVVLEEQVESKPQSNLQPYFEDWSQIEDENENDTPMIIPQLSDDRLLNLIEQQQQIKR